MKPIVFSKDVTVSVEDNDVEVTTFVDWQQSIDDETIMLVPQPVITRLDINSKEFWELVKRAAIELRLNTSNISTREHALVASEIAIAIQNSMDE